MPARARKKKPTTSALLQLEGELTIFRAAELQPVILCSPPPAAIDLSRVTEIDTAGLQLLLLARRAAKAEQRELPLLSPSAAVSEVVALLNLGAALGLAVDKTGA